MTDKTAAFIAEIRGTPEFIAKSAADPKWQREIDNIERGLDALYRDSEMIEILDRIQSVVARKSFSIKKRLLELRKLLVQARDLGKSVQ